MGTADRYDPNKAAEVRKQQYEAAKAVLQASEAEDILLGISLARPELTIGTNYENTLSEPSVFLTGPPLSPEESTFPDFVLGGDKSVVAIRSPFLSVTASTQNIGSLNVIRGHRVTRTVTDKEGKVSTENHTQRESSSPNVPADSRSLKTLIRWYGEAIGLIPHGQQRDERIDSLLR